MCHSTTSGDVTSLGLIQEVGKISTTPFLNKIAYHRALRGVIGRFTDFIFYN